jgi:mRNA interferase RelE/StbE
MRILGRLDRRTQKRLADAVEQMATDPFKGDVRPLAGEPDAYRRRVGDWRVLFRVDQATHAVTVYRIGPRGDVYGR